MQVTDLLKRNKTLSSKVSAVKLGEIVLEKGQAARVIHLPPQRVQPISESTQNLMWDQNNKIVSQDFEIRRLRSQVLALQQRLEKLKDH